MEAHMTAVITLNGQLLIEDLYYLVHQIEPNKLKEEMVSEIRQRIQRLQTEIKTFLERTESREESPQQKLKNKLSELQQLLEERKRKSQASAC